ncbi:Hsp70 protein [Streptomyces sp. TLI_235]|nr:Hsp70 family protein [Streptomyces sp. TLI_235]PBC75971.1 Hsp70 protein [Streptomyces sp. TLI_235]
MYPLGIDLGTTFTGAAMWWDGSARTVKLGMNTDDMASAIYFQQGGGTLFGDAALARGAVDPRRLAHRFKPTLGQDAPVRVGGRGYPPHELTGRLLRHVLDAAAEQERGVRPGHVVLTHPAGWDGHRRDALREAAVFAGLGDVGLLPEPVAAGTYYVSQQQVVPVGTGSVIGVYDLGGGTFDASVVRKTGTGVEIHGEPAGDDTVGGIWFDALLLRHVEAAAGIDEDRFDPDDPAVESARQRLYGDVVKAKELLSEVEEHVVQVRLPGLYRDVVVTRAEFEGLIRPRIVDTVRLFAETLERAGVRAAELDTVLLVGGSSRIPLVARVLREELGVTVQRQSHHKHVVSLGAAIAAAPRPVPAPAPLPPAAEPPAHEAPTAPPPRTPELEVDTDLVATGLTEATDTVVIHTASDQGTGGGRLTAVLVIAVLLVVLALVTMLAFRNRGGEAEGAGQAPSSRAAASTSQLRTATSAVRPNSGAVSGFRLS